MALPLEHHHFQGLGKIRRHRDTGDPSTDDHDIHDFRTHAVTTSRLLEDYKSGGWTAIPMIFTYGS
jgi:hypothetical protein